jgi:transcriptional regulator with XRE-family HTH domain
MDNILAMEKYLFEKKTPLDIARIVSANLRKRRKEMKLTQEEFSKKSGVSLGSIKRFETSYQISLISLIKIAFVIECSDELAGLFSQKKYNSIGDIIREGENREKR